MTITKNMKLMVTAGTIAGCGVASAQSVAFNGALDIGLYTDANNQTQLGNIKRSMVQVTGSQDLDDGMSATFKLRARLDLDTGNLEGAPASGVDSVKTNQVTKPFLQGESTVGIKGAFGSIRLGRALDAIQDQDWAYDAWGADDRIASPAWDFWHWSYSADPRGGGSGRVASGVFYDSPKWSNTSIHLSYSPEFSAGDLNRTQALSLTYDGDIFGAMFGTARNSAGAGENSVGLRGKYNDFTLMGMYNYDKTASGDNATASTFGATYKQASNTWKLGYGQVDVNAATPKLVTKLSVGINRDMKKNFMVYADASMKKDSVTGETSMYGVGMTYKF